MNGVPHLFGICHYNKLPFQWVAGDMGSGLVVLLVEGALICKSFAISRNLLVLEEAVSLESARRRSQASNTETRKCDY